MLLLVLLPPLLPLQALLLPPYPPPTANISQSPPQQGQPLLRRLHAVAIAAAASVAGASCFGLFCCLSCWFRPSLTGCHHSSDNVDVWMIGAEEKLDYVAAVKSQLETLAIPVFMVETFGAVDSSGRQTSVGLYNALALVAFCSDDYGTKTGAQYETFVELRYAHQNVIPIIPVQLHDTYPPQPLDAEGRAQNALVLRRDIIRILDIGMHPSPCPGNILRWSAELLAVVSILRYYVTVEDSLRQALSSFLSSKNLVLTTSEARSAKGRPADCGGLE